MSLIQLSNEDKETLKNSNSGNDSEPDESEAERVVSKKNSVEVDDSDDSENETPKEEVKEEVKEDVKEEVKEVVSKTTTEKKKPVVRKKKPEAVAVN